MSPAQAAQAAGVSRWSVLRAIKALKLQAKRDNRGHWRIAPDDLADWCAAQGAHSVRDGAVNNMPPHRMMRRRKCGNGWLKRSAGRL